MIDVVYIVFIFIVGKIYIEVYVILIVVYF